MRMKSDKRYDFPCRRASCPCCECWRTFVSPERADRCPRLVCGVDVYLWQVRKVKREISKLKVQELPPLVYQLLLLSTHGQRQAILVSSQTKWEPLVANSNLALNVMRWQEMVLSLFNTLDASSSEQVVGV